ncbi:hypothetical protein ACQKDS_10290 [Serratia sp. NPDC078593]|uniref:hypothetical protein n=1 Tax=unclassified Serratia (in: enterobacteria) TaxID=2647522 RepID=UPI0037CE6DBC
MFFKNKYLTLFLLSLAASGCSIKTDKTHQRVVDNNTEAGQIQLCQRELEAMQTVDTELHAAYQRRFEHMIARAAEYAGVRAQVNRGTQDTLDALYRYRVNRLCAEINQALLVALSDRVEAPQ